MNATDEIDNVDIDWCESCNGSGEIGTGEREYETGAWVTRECGQCEGTGQKGSPACV